MKIELKLKIDYNVDALREAGSSDEDTRAELEKALAATVDRLVGEGGLSGDTLATVDTWEALFSAGEHFYAGGNRYST